MLIAVYITLVWIGSSTGVLFGGGDECWTKEVTVAQLAMCQCCFEVQQQEGCSQDRIMESLKPYNGDRCLNELNYYTAKGPYKRLKGKISLDDFIKWCRKIVATPDAYYTDIFALSMNTLNWSDGLKVVMLEAVSKPNMKKFYDRVNDRIHELVRNKFDEFFAKLYDNITKNTDYMATCLTYLHDCQDYFTAYFDKKPYKGCSSSDVSDIIGPIIDGLPRKEIIIKKLSPRGIGLREEVKQGLLYQFCSKDKGKPKYLAFTKWSINQMRPFFYHTAKFYWPLEIMYDFLGVDLNKLSAFITEHTERRKYWDLGDVVNLVNNGCIRVEQLDGVILSYKILSNNFVGCIEVVLEAMNYAKTIDLAGRAVYDSFAYNFFTFIHKEKFPSLVNRKGYRREPTYLRDVLKKFIEFKNTDKGSVPFVTHSMLQHDEMKLGTRSLINFFMINHYLNINEYEFEKIFNKLMAIPLKVEVTENEKIFGKVTKDHCIVDNSSDTVCKIRRKLSYQPILNQGFFPYEKRWGKMVFVAIHATAFRYIADIITLNQYVDELVKCLGDIAESKDKLQFYCGDFKVNPYFGEFDNIISDKYPSYGMA